MADYMYTDNELIDMVRQGNECAEEELAKRYSKLVRICSRPYFLAGGDTEDLIQEGMLGLLSAIRKFDCNGTASFKTYAEQCIRNRLITAVESASRFKHNPLNDGVSYEALMGSDPVSVCLPGEDTFSRQTEDQVLAKECEENFFQDDAAFLSKFEKDVLKMYLEGMSYKEIANHLKKTEKSIDNAVQRIRRKYAQNR